MDKKIIYDREMNIHRCYSTEYQGMKVKYIDHMGNDLSVVNSAYASFGKMEHEYNPDKHDRLIQYLSRGMGEADFEKLTANLAYETTDVKDVAKALWQFRNTPVHWSPFAHTCITLQCTVPIAIHAQLVKHTVGFNINTVSRRYVSTTPELFIPEFREKAPNVKQGSLDTEHLDNKEFKGRYKQLCNIAINYYEFLISQGVAAEQARFILPQGVMTEFVWTGNVASFARMFNQRTDSHSQKEIQDLATMVGEIIEPLYPVSWNALTGN